MHVAVWRPSTFAGIPTGTYYGTGVFAECVYCGHFGGRWLPLCELSITIAPLVPAPLLPFFFLLRFDEPNGTTRFRNYLQHSVFTLFDSITFSQSGESNANHCSHSPHICPFKIHRTHSHSLPFSFKHFSLPISMVRAHCWMWNVQSVLVYKWLQMAKGRRRKKRRYGGTKMSSISYDSRKSREQKTQNHPSRLPAFKWTIIFVS